MSLARTKFIASILSALFILLPVNSHASGGDHEAAINTVLEQASKRSIVPVSEPDRNKLRDEFRVVGSKLTALEKRELVALYSSLLELKAPEASNDGEKKTIRERAATDLVKLLDKERMISVFGTTETDALERLIKLIFHKDALNAGELSEDQQAALDAFKAAFSSPKKEEPKLRPAPQLKPSAQNTDGGEPLPAPGNGPTAPKDEIATPSPGGNGNPVGPPGGNGIPGGNGVPGNGLADGQFADQPGGGRGLGNRGNPNPQQSQPPPGGSGSAGYQKNQSKPELGNVPSPETPSQFQAPQMPGDTEILSQLRDIPRTDTQLSPDTIDELVKSASSDTLLQATLARGQGQMASAATKAQQRRVNTSPGTTTSRLQGGAMSVMGGAGGPRSRIAPTIINRTTQSQTTGVNLLRPTFRRSTQSATRRAGSARAISRSGQGPRQR